MAFGGGYKSLYTPLGYGRGLTLQCAVRGLRVSDVNESTLFPVVLFVHAESYDVGTGNAYDGSVLAAFAHLIVVTFNFRLGALGRTK